MLQTLFHIPSAIGGIPVFGLGLLFAVWAVLCAGALAWLVRRQGFNAETRGYLPVMLVLGAVIVWVLPVLCDARGLPIRGYGMMILIAVVSSLGLAVWRARRAGVDPEMIFALAFWMILPGIVGARLVYVTEYWTRQYWPAYTDYLHEHPTEHLGAVMHLLGTVINVTSGGLVVYGALIGAVVGFLAFRWKYRIPILATADIIAPSLVLRAICRGRSSFRGTAPPRFTRFRTAKRRSSV
jgi:phosphatidylglycerol---prolipoprotein diacylglyceryl transferase